MAATPTSEAARTKDMTTWATMASVISLLLLFIMTASMVEATSSTDADARTSASRPAKHAVRHLAIPPVSAWHCCDNVHLLRMPLSLGNAMLRLSSSCTSSCITAVDMVPPGSLSTACYHKRVGWWTWRVNDYTHTRTSTTSQPLARVPVSHGAKGNAKLAKARCGAWRHFFELTFGRVAQGSSQ